MWRRFQKKLKQCPKHKLSNELLLETFCRFLNAITKVVPDTIVGGSLMKHIYIVSAMVLDWVTRTSRAWQP